MLGQNYLANNPLAYLIWIPVIAFGWALLQVGSQGSYTDDRELNMLLGGAGVIVFGLVIGWGTFHWPWVFAVDRLGILAWPFWALSLAWLLFGVGITRRLLLPLGYLLLCWPPLYTRAVAITMPRLDQLAVAALAIADRVAWIRRVPGTGTFLVHAPHGWVPVYVSQLCSGADSLIAVLLFLPVVLAFFSGPMAKKLGLLAGVACASVVMNLVRLEIIIGLLHWTGPTLALNIVHPVLGIILLGILMAALLKAAQRLGFHLALPRLSWDVAKNKALAGIIFSVAAAGALWLGLSPLGKRGPGTPTQPVAVSGIRLARYLPAIPGFRQKVVLSRSEASILGPDARTLAVNYTQGSHIVMAEVWRTQEPLVLAGLGGRNCLLFHGNRILREAPVSLKHHIQGTAFVLVAPSVVISGPGNEFVDMEYTVAARTASGKHWYFRVEVASWIAGGVKDTPQSQRAAKQILSRVKHPGVSQAAWPINVVEQHVSQTFE